MPKKISTVLLVLVTVPVGGSVQQAINKAQPGDTVVLPPNATFVESITLPNKGSSATTTITTAGGGSMAKILSPGDNLPALTTAPGASHYYISNIEFGKKDPSARVTNLILFGTGDETSVDQEPSHITLDHMYAHGDPNSDLRRCIALNGSDLNVLNSKVTECHERGADSQAIAGWNGPGPFDIENNDLEAASENILFGGADPKIQGLIPSNITIKNNIITKPLEWRGQGFVVKNLFELKNAQNVLFDGNTLSNSWTDGQTGNAILLKSANQDGHCPWCVTQHVVLSNNVIRNAEEGVRINAAEGNPLPQKANDITFVNDTFQNISGKAFQIFGGTANVTLDHVQSSSGTGILFADTAPNPGLVVKNSTFINPLYGVGAGSEEGQPYLDKWFPGAVWENNKILKQGTLTSSTPVIVPSPVIQTLASSSTPTSSPTTQTPIETSPPSPTPTPVFSPASVSTPTPLSAPSLIEQITSWVEMRYQQTGGR